jgi:hypothetical protein
VRSMESLLRLILRLQNDFSLLDKTKIKTIYGVVPDYKESLRKCCKVKSELK